MSSHTFPERILQFGTGILLKGLPDYFVDKANKKGIFKGSILVVKSTEGVITHAADGGYDFPTFVRGRSDDKNVEEEFVNTSISRILSANDDWAGVLKSAGQKELQVVISNTTEVGLQYVEESIHLQPPASFPAKLTAFLYERFACLGDESPEMVIVPTELIPDNGKLLREIVLRIVEHNSLAPDFISWLDRKVIFCSSLVDRIVTRPSNKIQASMAQPDASAIQVEPYRLWAIEGEERVKSILTFAAADDGVIIAPDIGYYRERKLRLLNGTHTISVCLGFLKGHDTVFECMQDGFMQSFMREVLIGEIMPSLNSGTEGENKKFGNEVLDRFNNAYMEHRLLSITFQSTMKMRMRNIMTLTRYVKKFSALPERFVQGFAAWLLFMKAVKTADGKYYGVRKGIDYEIQDDAAGYLMEQWKVADIHDLVRRVCANSELWDSNLNDIPGFTQSVAQQLEILIAETQIT